MMADPTELLELASRCEAASGVDRELDFDIAEAVATDKDHWAGCRMRRSDPIKFPLAEFRSWEWGQPAYTASLDAADQLAQSLPAGWSIQVTDFRNSSKVIVAMVGQPGERANSAAATEPLARTACILRALASRKDGQP